ncbi:cysteine-rich hydrophobic domain-containing protein 2-like [Schistocerca serialis cubense]|uniref:cysteine-rich hydrophobic domain-containing protein 2-like n=1 Tax=Schistocerca serialis cubense TaxID=2023355 RepID=UPI00214E1F7C|nr:cysteine-rich hydrophobic domain-containing protein 2-like [Schistocerca serialis cubense]
MTDCCMVYADDASDDEDVRPDKCLEEPVLVRAAVRRGTPALGLAACFSDTLPERLRGRVAPEEFARSVWRVNAAARRAAPGWARCVAGWAGCALCCCTLGCSLWPALWLARRSRRAALRALRRENARLYRRLGLRWRLARVASVDAPGLSEYVLAIDFLPPNGIYSPD